MAPSSSALASVLAVAARMISAEVGPPRRIVAAWITHLAGISPALVATASPSPIGASSSLSSWIDPPAGPDDRPGDAAAVPEVGVRRVRDRVDLELRDVGLLDLDLRHRVPAPSLEPQALAEAPAGRVAVPSGVEAGVGAADRNAEALAADLRRRLVERRRAEAAAGGARGDELEDAVAELVDEHAAVLSEPAARRIRELILRDTVGLGPLEQLLADPAVDRGDGERGRTRSTSSAAAGSSRPRSGSRRKRALRDAIERILAPLGRRVDELSPMVDARLADGSRVNVVIPPLAVDGPALSIRRFTAARPGPDELVASGTLTAELRDLLAAAVRARRSILISGGTGSGKTTLLNALSAYIGPGERVITIEDAAELRLRQHHVVRLESRPPSVEGRGEVTIRDLLRNALRMRPDRIVIGEVRGREALDLLTALNTGHDGALRPCTRTRPPDALRRLETLALMAGVGLPHEAIREQVRRGIELVVHLARSPQGERRVVEVGEVVRAAGGVGVREVWRDDGDGLEA